MHILCLQGHGVKKMSRPRQSTILAADKHFFFFAFVKSINFEWI